MITKEERLAIAALRRVAKRWPKSLMLVHFGSSGGALSVMRVPADWAEHDSRGLGGLEGVASVIGFNADSCA